MAMGPTGVCHHINTVRCANCLPWGSDRYYTPYPTVPLAPPYSHPTQQGWVCPVCGTVMAPWMPTCTGDHSRSPTTNTSTFIFNNNPIEEGDEGEEDPPPQWDPRMVPGR